MTQIKIFSTTTFSEWGKSKPTIEDFQEEVNAFLAENAGKIVVKDIKYTTQCENPQGRAFDLEVIGWALMIIYETK